MATLSDIPPATRPAWGENSIAIPDDCEIVQKGNIIYFVPKTKIEDSSNTAPTVQTADRAVSAPAPATSNNNCMEVTFGFCGCMLQCLSVMTMSM